jgi:hypothetical protein
LWPWKTEEPVQECGDSSICVPWRQKNQCKGGGSLVSVAMAWDEQRVRVWRVLHSVFMGKRRD